MIRDEYGVKERSRAPEGYKILTETLTNKLELLRKKMRDIDKRNIQIMALGNEVALFTGINVKGIGSGNGGSDRAFYAKCLFSKWGMENGLPGVLLSEYMRTYNVAASKMRMSFTRKFKTSKETREFWERWKKHMEDRISLNGTSGEKY